MRRPLSLVVAAWTMMCVGCFHYSAELPGVLDLRSDGRDTGPPSETPAVDAPLARSGFDAILDGSGVKVDGSRVEVEERHAWMGITWLAPGALLVFNGDPKPELQAALGENGALRNVYVGHELGAMDALTCAGTNACLMACLPVGAVVNLFAPIYPTMSFTASGERISTTPGGPASRVPLDVSPTPSATEPTPGADTLEEPGTREEPGAPDAAPPAPALPGQVPDAAPDAAQPAPVEDAPAPIEAPAVEEDDK